MKNKLILTILIFFILKSFAISDEFIFKTKKIEIIEKGKFINATDGKVISNDGNTEITAKNFKYDKNQNILSIYGKGSIIIKPQKIEIFLMMQL